MKIDASIGRIMAKVGDSVILILILLRVLKGQITKRLLDSVVIALSAMRVLTAIRRVAPSNLKNSGSKILLFEEDSA